MLFVIHLIWMHWVQLHIFLLHGIHSFTHVGFLRKEQSQKRTLWISHIPKIDSWEFYIISFSEISCIEIEHIVIVLNNDHVTWGQFLKFCTRRQHHSLFIPPLVQGSRHLSQFWILSTTVNNLVYGSAKSCPSNLFSLDVVLSKLEWLGDCSIETMWTDPWEKEGRTTF